jgi:sigma-B regulation protein RsbU (phosphoserine phosphatase)
LFLLNAAGDGGFISAAHNATYVYRAATGQIEDLISDAYFLGMFSFATWQSRPLHLAEGDILVVYSDGLTDAEDSCQQHFGARRLREVIRQQGPSGPQAIEHALLEALEAFTEGTPQTDDITFVIVARNAASLKPPE